jgi:hypothetical protein
MSPLASVILKNTLLLILIVISLVFVFTPNIGFNEINYIYGALGILYTISACLEAMALSKIHSSSKRFTYFTNGFVAKRFLKIIFIAFSGCVLLYSNSIIRYMSPICFIIAFTEIIVTIWRYIKNLCFIALQDDTIIISTNKQVRLNASQIRKIEFRHGLTYIINNQNKALTLRTDVMKDQEIFKTELLKWVEENNLNNLVIKN